MTIRSAIARAVAQEDVGLSATRLPSTTGVFATRVVTRGVDVTINAGYKHSRVKEYFKEGRALRIETVVNDSTDLGQEQGDWKGLPYLDEITFRIVPNINTRAALLESGEVDMVLAPSLPDAMRLKETKGLKTVEGLGTQQYGMTINGKSGPLSDKKVRQAIQCAVDKEGLIKTVMLGNASAAKSVYFTPNVSGYFDTGAYPFDANKSKALLDEAGWKLGADGIREKDGKKLSFGLLTRRGSVAGDFEIAELTQAMLKAVGMDMKIELMEAAAYLPRLNRAGEPDYDMTNASNNTGSGDGEAIMETHYRSDAVPPRYYNYSWYSNPEVDKLTEQARSVPTLEERNKIYAQVQKIVVEDASWLILFDVKQISVMKDDVQGVYLEPAGNNFPAKYAWRGKA